MKNIALTKGKWRFAYMKDDEVKAKGFEPLCLADFSGGETYAAKVPGCFEYNLYLIGKAPDPYFSDNIYVFASTRVIISGISPRSTANSVTGYCVSMA